MYNENELLTVCAAENGYIVKVMGREKGEKPPKKSKDMMWMHHEPEMYVVGSLSELKAFVDEKLPLLVPYSADKEYSDSFEKEVKNG